MDAVMQTATVRQTALPLERAAVVEFPEGLVGLPEAKHFDFEVSEEITPLLRMRCLDRKDLSFLVVNPELVLAGYQPKFGPDALHAIGLAEGGPSLVLAVAQIAPRLEDCTANLLAPLLINPASMKGLQVILDPGRYTTRHPLVASQE